MSAGDGGRTSTRSPVAVNGRASAAGPATSSADNATSQDDTQRVGDDGDVGARVGGVDDEVGVRALLDAGTAEPLARAPRRGGQRPRRCVSPALVSSTISCGDEAVRQEPPASVPT